MSDALTYKWPGKTQISLPGHTGKNEPPFRNHFRGVPSLVHLQQLLPTCKVPLHGVLHHTSCCTVAKLKVLGKLEVEGCSRECVIVRSSFRSVPRPDQYDTPMCTTVCQARTMSTIRSAAAAGEPECRSLSWIGNHVRTERPGVELRKPLAAHKAYAVDSSSSNNLLLDYRRRCTGQERLAYSLPFL